MDFYIFTLGDGVIYRDVLNGIAMIFNSGGLVGGLGIGVFTGAIMLTIIMISRAVFDRNIDFKTLIFPLVVYIILTVPKGTVVVNDVYNTNAPQRIDNIPIGLAFTASTVSGVSYLITKGFEVVLTIIPVSAEVGALPKMTEEGFLTPLQVLNQIRFDDINSTHPSFQQAINSLYNECVMNNNAFNPQVYKKSTDPFNYLIDVAKSGNGMVIIPKNEAGLLNVVSMNCSLAADTIHASFGAYMNGSTDINGIINMSIGRNSFKDRLVKRMSTEYNYGKVNDVNGLNHYTNDQITAMVGNALGLNQVRAQQFTNMIVFDPLVKTAALCTEKYNTFNMSLCTGWVTANEQWKTTSALSGNSFLKNIRNGQNILILVGFMLFPIIVFVIMLQGMGSIKAVAGYVAFMLSNFLWLPFGTMINFYNQYQFQEALYQLGLTSDTASLTLTQAPQLYEMLSTKLALGNQMLGMVPILTLLLFGGGLMVMRGFTQASNVADAGGYDAKLNSKTIKDSAPFSESSSLIHREGYSSTQVQGVGGVQFKVESAMSAAQTQVNAITMRESQIVGRLSEIADKASNTYTLGSDYKQGEKEGKSTGESIDHSIGSGENKTFTVSDGKNTSGSAVLNSDEVLVNKGNTAAEVRSGGVGADVNGRIAADVHFGKGALAKIKDTLKIGGQASVGGDITVAAANASSVSATRTVVGDEAKDPTEKSQGMKIDNLTVGNANANQYSGKEGRYSVNSSNSNEFKAKALNEAIQNDRSGTISASEKKEASNLLEEMKSLTHHKGQVYSSVLSNSISDRDLTGMLNPLNNRSGEIKENLNQIDKDGSKSVENWDTLKAMGEKNARLGGNYDQDTIKNIGIFFAASHSKNPTITLAAINTVSTIGLNNRFEQEKGMYQAGENSEQQVAQARKELEDNKKIDTSMLVGKEGVSIASLSIINKAIKETKEAEGLASQVLEKPVNNVNAEVKEIDFNEQEKLIKANYQLNRNIVRTESLVLIEPLKGPEKLDGSLEKPVIEKPIDDKTIKTTKMTDDLNAAAAKKDKTKVIELLTLENDIQSGVDAERKAIEAKQEVLKNISEALKKK